MKNYMHRLTEHFNAQEDTGAPFHGNFNSILRRDHPVSPHSYLLNPIELMWSAFKSNAKRMLQERMPDILSMNQAAVLPVY